METSIKKRILHCRIDSRIAKLLDEAKAEVELVSIAGMKWKRIYDRNDYDYPFIRKINNK